MKFVTEDEMNRFGEKIKQTSCPFCRAVGKLIFHGYLRGNGKDPWSVVKRGRRIFCNDRKKSSGCGKTFSLLLVFFVAGCSVTSATLSNVILSMFESKSPKVIAEETLSGFSFRYVYSLLSRLLKRQSFLRDKLTSIVQVPECMEEEKPLIQTFLHLISAFGESCPVSSFQRHFQASFL